MSYILSYYYENVYFKEIKGHFSSLQAMINRGILISETRLLNRKIELVSSEWIPGEGKGSRETALTKIKQDLKSGYLELQKCEQNSTPGFNALTSASPNLLETFIFPFRYRMKDSTEKDLKTSYRAGVYQYLSSLSIVMNAEIDSLTRYDKKSRLINFNNNSNSTLTNERMHFHRADYNSIHSLRTGNYRMIDIFNRFMGRRILNLRWLSMVGIIVHFSWWWIAIFTLFPLMFKIVNNNSDILSLFGLIELGEVEALTEQIETFKTIYLNNYLMIEAKRSRRERKKKADSLDQILGRIEEEEGQRTIKSDRSYRRSGGNNLEKKGSKVGEGSDVEDFSENKNEAKIKHSNEDSNELELEAENYKNFAEKTKFNQKLNFEDFDKKKKNKGLFRDQRAKTGKEKRLIQRKLAGYTNQEKMKKNLLRRQKSNLKDNKDYQRVSQEQNNYQKLTSLTSRRQKLQGGDESIMMRVNKLIKKAHGRGRYIIYLIMVPIFGSAFCIGVTLGLIKNNYATSLLKIKRNKLKIGEISLNINTAFNLIYQGLAQAPEPLNPNGKKFAQILAVLSQKFKFFMIVC